LQSLNCPCTRILVVKKDMAQKPGPSKNKKAMVTDKWSIWGRNNSNCCNSGDKSSGKSDWKGWNNSQQDSASQEKSAGGRKKDDWQVIHIQKPEKRKHIGYGNVSTDWGTQTCNRTSSYAVRIPTSSSCYEQNKRLLKFDNIANKENKMFGKTDDNLTKRRDDRSSQQNSLSKSNSNKNSGCSSGGDVLYDWVNNMDN